MRLEDELLSQFAKITYDNSQSKKTETISYGTITESNGVKYVKLDGSDILTPIDSTTNTKDGERVTVMIKNHMAVVTGNLSSPAARTEEVEEVNTKVTNLEADNVTVKGNLEAINADITNLKADNVTINDTLTANQADITDLKAQNVTINGKLEAVDADIDSLQADNVSIKGTLTAHDASIISLETNKLSAEQADLKYANIDFANIGMAAVEKLFTESGIIKDLTVGTTSITGELVGVTIKGDLIEGGTVVADKLVIKGNDGLYYKLNTDGVTTEADQTEYNSINGSVITAKSITATKISVDDLVAFGATIGGFHITDNALYSGVKSSVDNTTIGTYLDKEGQIAFGNSSKFMKFYKDQNGDYKLEISADSIKFGSSGTGLENAITDSIEEFYISTSPTELSGGSWSTDQPLWSENTYIWRRSHVTYADGTSKYTPSEDGLCISGSSGTDAITLTITSSSGNIFKNNSGSTVLTANVYIGGSEVTIADDGTCSLGVIKWYKDDSTESVGTSKSITVTAADVDSSAVYTCQLEQ